MLMAMEMLAHGFPAPRQPTSSDMAKVKMGRRKVW